MLNPGIAARQGGAKVKTFQSVATARTTISNPEEDRDDVDHVAVVRYSRQREPEDPDDDDDPDGGEAVAPERVSDFDR